LPDGDLPGVVDAALANEIDTGGRRVGTTELAERPLVVVPTGVLHSVPWSILPSCAGRPVTVAPSATLWHAAAATRADAAGPANDGRCRVVAAGPGLPGARAEAYAVAAIYGTSPLVDAAATVDAVLTALAGADIAHLAAHGRLSADNPLFSDLLLADGRLPAAPSIRPLRPPRPASCASAPGYDPSPPYPTCQPAARAG
jgi:CHAT domain-containing protein